MAQGPTKPMYKRMLAVKIILLVGAFGVLAAQLFRLQVISYEELQNKALSQQTSVVTVNAKRGTIYDRNGTELAISATAYMVYIVPNLIDEEDEDTIINGLSSILAEDETELEKKKQEIAEAVSKKNSSYVRVARRIESDVAAEVKEFISENEFYNCINTSEDPKRYYPDSTMAAQVIGFVGDDNQGLYGLEAKFDSYLQGTPGRLITTRTPGSNKIPFDFENYIEPQDGNSLVLTLDSVVQHYVEKYLEDFYKTNKPAERCATIVMNVKTGEILAMATMPSFDLNDPFTLTDPFSIELLEQLDPDNFSSAEAFTEAFMSSQNSAMKSLQNSVETDENGVITDVEAAYSQIRKELLEKMWNNKTISDNYDSGSVFKCITSAIALDINAVTTGDTFNCPGYHIVEGVKIRCASRYGHGTLTFAQGLAKSCNPVYMKVAEKIGSQNMFDYIKLFGFGQKTGIDLPAEEAGVLHSFESLENPVTLAVTSFGQQFKVTMIQLAAAIGAIANGGTLLKPHIVKEIVDSNGNVIESFGTEEVRQVISEEAAKEVLEMMVGVVEVDGSTGMNARMEGYLIGGKTGTSEKLDKRNEEGVVDKYIYSFVTVAPADDPEILVLTISDENDETVAVGATAPWTKNPAKMNKLILDEVLPYLGIEPNLTEDEEQITVPNLKDKTVGEAKEILSGLGLKYKVNGSEEDKIITQMPMRGEKLNPGDTVILNTVETDEDNMVEIPDVIGMSMAKAKATLEKAGFNVKLQENYRDINEMFVSDQYPASGEKRSPGSLITLDLAYDQELEFH